LIVALNATYNGSMAERPGGKPDGDPKRKNKWLQH